MNKQKLAAELLGGPETMEALRMSPFLQKQAESLDLSQLAELVAGTLNRITRELDAFTSDGVSSLTESARKNIQTMAEEKETFRNILLAIGETQNAHSNTL